MGKRISVFVILAAVMAVQAAGLCADRVSARTEKTVIPTFDISKGDPSPTIFDYDSHSAYPRAAFDINTRSEEPVDRQYDMAVIENEYLRVDVLSEVGGRVWRIVDRKTGRNVLWTNDAIKPVRVGRRSGWVAGGIEYPFPVGNHGEDTIDPYRSAIRENADGSATISVAMFDHFYGFWGSYDATLFPGESRLALTVRLYNPTSVRNRYQLWINAAVPVQQDMQYIFPVDYVAGHGFGGLHPWPMMRDGKADRSFWKNQPGQLGVFGWDADFMAAYYHYDGYGIVRYCSREFAQGIKMWTWGTNSDWAPEYSINNGPYGELQSGRFPTQEMYGWLEPHQMDTWTEYWYPVHALEGVDAASKDAAMGVEVLYRRGKPDTAEIRLEVLRGVEGTLSASLGERELFKKEVLLLPGNVLKETAPVRGAGNDDVLSVSLRDREGFVVISYDRAILRKAGKKPKLPNPVAVDGDTEVWKEYASGLESELNDADVDGAVETYRNVARDNADFAPAWKALGILLYKQADGEGAHEALERAAALDATDLEAAYYLGLAKLDLGRPDALDLLKSISGDARFTHLAKFAVGIAALKSGDAAGAVTTLTEAGLGWSGDAILWDYLAVAARLTGDKAAASDALAAALSAEPLDPFAAVEGLVAAGTASAEAIQTALGADEDIYVEVAFYYGAIGQNRTALEIARAGEDKASSGLYYYYLSWFAGHAGDEEAARDYAARAGTMGTDYVFPHRREDVAVFDAAAALGAGPGLSTYNKAVLLHWLGRPDDALGLWTGLLGKYDVPGLTLRIADAYSLSKLPRDARTGVQMYRRALDENPNDRRVYYALDNLYEEMENDDAREELLKKGRELFPEDDQLLLRSARLLVAQRKAGEAAKLMEGHTYQRAHQSWELMHVGRAAIEETYTALAMGAMREGDRKKALKHLEKAANARETLRKWFD